MVLTLFLERKKHKVHWTFPNRSHFISCVEETQNPLDFP